MDGAETAERSSIIRGRLRPLLGLGLIILFHNVVSLVSIAMLDRTFNFGRRCVLLHLSVVNGFIAAITICLGLSLFFRCVREKLLPKLLMSCVPAAAFSALMFLYLANYISNARWGNNFNYQVLAQWQFREMFGGGGQILSSQVYVSIIVGLAIIFALYLALAKAIFRGLSQLFLPDQSLSLVANRSRAIGSLVLIMIVSGLFSIYLLALARSVKAVNHLIDEPIIGFFRTETASADDLNRQRLYPQMLERENTARAAYPRNHQYSRKNVIIIIVDSLRADHLQVYGYQRPTTPFLSSLFTSGRLKKINLALSTCPYTSCGVLSTMASKNARGLIDGNFKLYDLLFDQGYQVNFILSGNHDWYGMKESFGKSITHYFDGSMSSKYSPNDDRAIFEGLQPVAAYSGTPAFFYFHLMSPHYIGVKQDEYRIYNPSQVEGTWEALVSGRHDVVTKTNNYDNSIIQADATIQEIFQTLKQKGYLDDSLVVILGDHGEGLGERGPDYYSHTLTLYQEFLLIPLLIYDTVESSYANLEFGTQIDVAPTVLERLGLPIPASWQGRSLLNPQVKDYSFHETRWNRIPIYAVIERNQSTMYKYIHSSGKPDELYELVTDPHERRNLIATADAGLVARLKGKLGEYLSHY